MYGVLHRSTKQPGKWQFSTFDEQGAVGDVNRDSCTRAVNDGIDQYGYRMRLEHVFSRRHGQLAGAPRKPFPPRSSGAAVPVLGALLALVTGAALLIRREVKKPMPNTQPVNPGLALGPPLALPLRSMTPNGYHNAPRWRLPDGGTTGDRNKAPPGAKVDHVHEGVDLQGKPGEDVIAVSDGVVQSVYPPGGGACMVGLKLALPDGRYAVYCDMGKVTTAVGARMRRGDVIGKVAPRGFVHIAVKDRSGKALDPAFLIPYRGSYVAA